MTLDQLFRQRRPFNADFISVPHDVAVASAPYGKALLWRFHQGREASAKKPTDNLLQRFLARFRGLREAEAANQALLFARMWGPLYLCSCGRPIPHRLNDPGPSCYERSPKETWEAEPVWGWLRFARSLEAALKISAATIHEGRPRLGADVDWEELYHTIPDLRYIRRTSANQGRGGKKSLAVADRDTLLFGLNLWIRQAFVRPAVWWEAHGMTVCFASGLGSFGSLYGALLMQLVLAVADSSGVAFCSGCTNFMFVERRRSSGNRRYCNECRNKGVPQRDAARDYRARRRGE